VKETRKNHILSECSVPREMEQKEIHLTDERGKSYVKAVKIGNLEIKNQWNILIFDLHYLV
jgi:hypothetical protein